LETAKSGRFTYYQCGTYLKKGKSVCQGQRIPAHLLENAMLDHLSANRFTVERVKSILKGIYTEAKAMDKRNDGQRKSIIRQLDVVKTKLERQFEAIESGAIELSLVAERIKELKERRTQLETSLGELKPSTLKTFPLHFFTDDSIAAFQQTIRELFFGAENRDTTKRYLRLFIEKIIITLAKSGDCWEDGGDSCHP